LAHALRGDAEYLAEAGISVDPSAVKVDFEKVMERVRRLRSDISHHDSAERYSTELGVEVFIGHAKFTSEKTVEVNGKTLNFKRAVVATGGYPSLIPMPGLKGLHEKHVAPGNDPRPQIVTNESVFNLTKRPKNMVVIGAGVIGLELAQAFERLGVSVTVLGRSGRVLPKEDEDMAEIVKTQMKKDGVQFRLSVAEYRRIELSGNVLDNGHPEMKVTIQEKNHSEPTELMCDVLLVAAGRRPNVTGMDLEAAGIEYDVSKGLLVNDNLRTTNKRVFAAGDCASDFKFTHAADFMARAVIRNALFLGKEKMSKLLIPYATFTTPEIASVGLYEKDLKEKGIPFRVIEKPFRDNDRAKLDNQTTGLVRFRVDAKTDEILGASIVGAGAGNMISEVTLAMQSGTGLRSLAAVIHPYPTTAEAIRQAGDVYNKTRLTTTVKSLLRSVIKLQR
jgi:pyruvate/2-oxoglutarate dehydrogenase complex dihydrolipoamide dehydrogenase (E3) component